MGLWQRASPPPRRVLGTPTALGTSPAVPCQPPLALLPLLPARRHCGLSPPAARAGLMALLQLAVPSLSSLVLLCCGNVTPATFSSSSPRPALEKEVFISSGFAFNSQRKKISFKSIKKKGSKETFCFERHFLPIVFC